MSKIKLYAKQFNVVIMVFGYIILCILAIAFTWKDNHEINNALFIVWFISVFVWMKIGAYICNHIINRYKIPADKLEAKYARAMKMPEGIKRYTALLSYHKESYLQCTMKVNNDHHLGFAAIDAFNKEANRHDEQYRLLKKKIEEERVKHSKH